MNYPRRFFEINLRFAQRVAEVSGQSLDSALLHDTNLYIRFGLGREFAATNPVWQEYLSGLRQAEDTVEWTYCFYLKRQQHNPEAWNSPFGCFSYTLVEGNRIRIHFHNNETSGHSPLKRGQMSKRLSELKAMFAHIKQEVGAATEVIGASWLYNLDAYRRLFPPAYLATVQIGGDDFPYLPLWGQFIDYRGCVKEDLAVQFLECLDKQHCLKGIEECFPFQVLHLRLPVQEFYEFYSV